MKIYCPLLFLTIVILGSCDTEEGLEIQTIRDFDIYANDTVNNNFVFDMVPTSQGYLIASICGTSRLASKFEGNGRLSLLEVDNFGNVLWEDICIDPLFESGYPSNLIRTEDEDNFYLFWNEYNGGLKVLPISTGSSPDSLSIVQMNCNGCRVDKGVLVDDKVYTTGISERGNEPVTIIAEFDINQATTRLMSEKTFDATSLGGFGLNDLNFVNRLNNFIHIESNDLRLLFSGPSEEQMILSHVGELIPEYDDDDLWVANIIPNPDRVEGFAVILQDPQNLLNQSIFLPNVNMSGLPGESGMNDLISQSQLRFSSLDPDYPQFIIYYNTNEWIVVGTSLSGFPTVVSINVETKQIVRSELGNNTLLNIAKAELRMGDLYLSGTTVLNNRLQRPFVLKVAKSDIF